MIFEKNITEKQFKEINEMLKNKKDELVDYSNLYNAYECEFGSMEYDCDPTDYFDGLIEEYGEYIYDYNNSKYIKKTVIDAILKSTLEARLECELLEDRRIHIQEQKEIKYKIAAEKRKQYRIRNREQLSDIKFQKNEIKRLNKRILNYNRQLNLCKTVNSVNQMFRDCGSPAPKDIKIPQENRYIKKLENEIKSREENIILIKNNIKEKEKKLKLLNKLKN